MTNMRIPRINASRIRLAELLSRELVTRQAQYIFICLRQAVLNFPAKYARTFVGLPSEHEARQVLTKAAHEFLTELASFPEKAINPDWMRTLEQDGQGEADGEPRRPARGQEIKAEQKKAAARRKQKTETMRKLRAMRA